MMQKFSLILKKIKKLDHLIKNCSTKIVVKNVFTYMDNYRKSH
jgi:hypothetical protein